MSKLFYIADRREGIFIKVNRYVNGEAVNENQLNALSVSNDAIETAVKSARERLNSINGSIKISEDNISQKSKNEKPE